MIPARYAASRFPGKLMQDLHGKTVIQRTYEASVNTGLFDDVFVVTDSDIIFKEITSNGGKAIMSIRTHECGSDRIAEAVQDMDVDIVVNVQGDEPFTDTESLRKVLEVFYEEGAEKIDLASLMKEIKSTEEITNPNAVKVIVDEEDFALYFSRSPIPYPRDQDVDTTYYKHKGIYAFRKQALLDFYRLPMGRLEASEKIECIRYLENGKTIKMVRTSATSVEIDTPEDLEQARLIFGKEAKPSETVVKSNFEVANNPHRNFPMVPRVVFGEGCFDQVPQIIEKKRSVGAPYIYLIDDVFEGNDAFIKRIKLKGNDAIKFISSAYEPKTSQVDRIVEQIKNDYQLLPSGIIGIGGGTLLDLAKAVSILLKNPGQAKDYQGWDLVSNPAVYHVGIPTISGTGAEVSRTTVLTGPEKKLGINSDYTPFDQVILDPDLTIDVPTDQWFYTGMDCYIHCIESLNGTYLNAFSQSYGEKAYELCKEIFLSELPDAEARGKLMMASWHGGMSIAYSQVGIAHAMSYGMSYVLGTKHGIGNCIVFDKLGEYYPEGVKLFKEMKAKHNVSLPQDLCSNLTDDQLQTMTDVAMSLTPLWENALGENWQSIMTEDKLKALFLEM